MARHPFIDVNGSGSAGPDPNQRMGFMTKRDVVATRGVKIKPKSAVQKEKEDQEREEYRARFDENADRTIQYHNDKERKAIDVIKRYMTMIEDKTLARNRGPIANDVEKEVRQDIIQLALDMNNDENEEDIAKGSVIVLSAVTKVLIRYRDRLNELEFEVQQLKKEQNKSSSQSAQQTSNAAK